MGVKKKEKDEGPTSWECSYVMSNGDGVNLLGKLDVDGNRARFVAASGLFGTACKGDGDSTSSYTTRFKRISHLRLTSPFFPGTPFTL